MSEREVDMMKNRCTRSEVFFLKDGWLNGYLHSENNLCLSTKHTNGILTACALKKKGVHFCLSVRCAYLVYSVTVSRCHGFMCCFQMEMCGSCFVLFACS